MTKSHDNSYPEAFVEAKSECLYCHQISLLSEYETVDCNCNGLPTHPAAKCPKCGKTIDVILVETKPNDNPPTEASMGAKTECPYCKTVSYIEPNRHAMPNPVWPYRTYFKCPNCHRTVSIVEIED
jgi:endogenous inhibitor of DNA gyrase (YacG/DUF329 family)